MKTAEKGCLEQAVRRSWKEECSAFPLVVSERRSPGQHRPTIWPRSSRQPLHLPTVALVSRSCEAQIVGAPDKVPIGGPKIKRSRTGALRVLSGVRHLRVSRATLTAALPSGLSAALTAALRAAADENSTFHCQGQDFTQGEHPVFETASRGCRTDCYSGYQRARNRDRQRRWAGVFRESLAGMESTTIDDIATFYRNEARATS